MNHRLPHLPSLLLLALPASPLLAQVQSVGGQIPVIQEPDSLFIPWAIAAAFAIGIILISFKTPKRNR